MPRRPRDFIALLLWAALAVGARGVHEVHGASSTDWPGRGSGVRSLQEAPEPVTQIVATCLELQEALKRESVVTIQIQGDIVCTRENWPDAIIVRRNLDVTKALLETGESVDAGVAGAQRASVNWTNVQNVLVVERAAVVFFHDLLMFQDDLGPSGGLDMQFMDTRKGATGVFSGLVVVVGSCGQPVEELEDLLDDWPRPEFLTGRQRARRIGLDTLLVGDVAIWYPEVASLWQVCNSVFVCSVPADLDARVAEHFNSPFVDSKCRNADQVNPNGARIGAESRGDGGQGGHQSNVGTVVLVVTVSGVVVAMAAGMTFYHVQRIKHHGAVREHRHSEAALKKEAEGGAGGPSFAMELFAENINVPLQDVEVGTLLGRGGFGKVYKGTWKGTIVAVKVIEHGQRLLENELKLPFEAYLSKHISHPNVVQTFVVHTRQQDSPHGVTVDTMELNDSLTQGGDNSLMSTHDIFSNMAKGSARNDGGELFETWLVLEYCDRGSLAKAVKRGLLGSQKSGQPRMDHVLLSALDVANAMNYLHSLGVTHGDLKADNVLLKSANTDKRGFFCKVSDFGLSRLMGKHEYLQTFTYGTITHMPPELLKDGILSPMVDVYSFGMLLWELLAELQPYAEKNHGEIILAVVNEGRRPHIDHTFPDSYADLIRDCWKQNRQDRPRFPDIVRRLKQMHVNLVTYGTPCGASVQDSVGSLSVIRRIGEPSMMGPQCTESLQREFDAGNLPAGITAMPEVRNYPYYETTNSIETKCALPKVLMPSHNSEDFIADFSNEGDSEVESECSGSSVGYRSAASQATQSSEHSASSFRFKPL